MSRAEIHHPATTITSAIVPVIQTSRQRAALMPSVTVASGRPTPTQPTTVPLNRTGAKTRSSWSTIATFGTE